MKCRNQLAISSKFNIANEYVLCRYKWHRPIVLIGHSFGGLVSKNLVVKLKRKSTIRIVLIPSLHVLVHYYSFSASLKTKERIEE
jgi:triacylglycerol esterase/lipase EstA (alpha/beta hydrolase family)